MNLCENDLEHFLNITEEHWLRNQEAKIFVTGGTGFFGKWIQETFAYACKQLGLKAKMTVLTRDTLKAKYEMSDLSTFINYCEGDICSFPYISGEFTHIIHGATPVQNLRHLYSDLNVFEVNYVGTKRVLDFAIQKKIDRFLLLSSGAVYGPQPMNIDFISESFFGCYNSMSPKFAYSEGKKTSESLLKLYLKSESISGCIARCFSFIGPHLPLDDTFAIGQFLRKIIDGENIEIKGSGQDVRSYMYTADLAAWLWVILLNGQDGEVYNVGSQEHITIKDLASKINQYGPATKKDIIFDAASNIQKPSFYVPNVSKAKQDLGLDVRICLDDAILRTFNWFQKTYNK